MFRCPQQFLGEGGNLSLWNVLCHFRVLFHGRIRIHGYAVKQFIISFQGITVCKIKFEGILVHFSEIMGQLCSVGFFLIFSHTVQTFSKTYG